MPFFDLKEAPWVPPSAGWHCGLEIEDVEKPYEERQKDKRKLAETNVSM